MSSSSEPDDQIYSRSLINEFDKFMTKIALELVQEDIRIIKFFIGERIPNDKLSSIEEGIQLVSVLKKYRLLSENNLDFFIELLEESRRVDLANRVREYQRTSVNTVRNAPQAQIEEKLPAPKMETLFLVITGEPESITAPKLDHIKTTICTALHFKKSEVFYIEVSQDKESSFYSQISFQLPETEEKINQLQMDAVNKKPWLSDLQVVELTVDNKSSIKIAEKKKISKEPKKTNGEMQSRPALPRVQNVLALDPTLKIHCDQTFDTILAIHLPVGYEFKRLNSMLRRCESAMKIYHSQHKHFVDSRLAVIRFGDHSSVPIRFPEEQKIAFLEKDLSHGLKFSSHVTPHGVCGGTATSGIADALVEACDLGKKMRREATKLCIIVHFLSTNSADLKHYRCPCDYDLVCQSHLLATHAIPLYIIGIDPDGRLASQKQVEENYLLSGITAMTGGRYFQIQDTCIHVLEKLIKCIIRENNSIEKNMGTVNDVVITEINKQYGDVNEVHLAEHLKNSCLQFCRVDCIRENGKPLTPVSQISQRVSWADNLDDAITGVDSMKTHMSTRNDQSTSKQNSSRPLESTASGYSGIQKPSEIRNVKQNPDLEISARMVRRQIERSAYYRPTTEKTNSS